MGLDGLFDAEILKAEVMRTTLLSGFALLGFAVFNVLAFLGPDRMRENLTATFPIRGMQLFFLGAFLYEVLARTIFATAQKRGWRVPFFGRMMNGLIETSLPGIPIYLVSTSVGPLVGLNSPAVFTYAFFVLLSVLRLDPWLSIFTGLVAAVQYLALFVVLAPPQATEGILLGITAPPVYVARSVLFLLLGLAAAFVALQLRHRVVSAFQSMQERDQIVGVFGRHVSPEVADRLIAGGADRGEKRAVSVMFLDIRGFTAFSESRTPEQVFEFLNALFSYMIEVVHRHNGIINKFLGDGFMAVFGAPLDSVAHKRESVQAARQIVSELDRRIADGELPAVEIGIGIHSGEAMTGNVGSERRMEYTIIGDVVNLASRFEQLNKESGTRVLLSGEVYADLPQSERVGIELFGNVKVRGRQQDVAAYAMRR